MALNSPASATANAAGDQTIVFDVETQKLADEVGGWNHIREMRMAVGVTYHVLTGQYKAYGEEQARDLIAALRGADLIVGYNVLRFDYEVLRAYTTDPLTDVPTVDMLAELYRCLGWRPSLDNVASATLGVGKSADGVQAVHWFRAGHIARVIEYCRHDVEITWRLFEHGRQHCCVKCWDRSRELITVPVRW
ncbi:MAG: helicase [Anaerolineales bacterium]|nr:helicase [Anaerolineales bacterium]